MSKLLILFLGITLVIVLIFAFIINKIRFTYKKIFQSEIPLSDKNKKDDVIYKNDDIVVLKGEAKNKNNPK